MTRNHSLLYTAASSASFPKKKAVAEEEKQKREQLLPAGEIVRDTIQKQVTKLMYGPYVDEEKMSDVQFRVERRARKLAVASLIEVQIELSNILRDHSKSEETWATPNDEQR